MTRRQSANPGHGCIAWTVVLGAGALPLEGFLGGMLSKNNNVCLFLCTPKLPGRWLAIQLPLACGCPSCCPICNDLTPGWLTAAWLPPSTFMTVLAIFKKERASPSRGGHCICNGSIKLQLTCWWPAGFSPHTSSSVSCNQHSWML